MEKDAPRLYYEESGSGTPLVFVHEFAGDHGSWEPQLRFFARYFRCVAYNARGFPPSDVPEDGARYSQAHARDDIVAVLDHLKIEKAHLVGLSMGGFAVLHAGIAYPQRARSLVIGGCGYGAEPDKKAKFQAECEAAAASFDANWSEAAKKYALGPTRGQFQKKDPRGWAEVAQQLRDGSSKGHALTMGGAGFVGLNVAEQLSARGEKVVLYDLSPPPPQFKWKVLAEKGDVTNRARLEEVFLQHQPTQVVHLAAITAGPQRDANAPRRIAEVNLIGTINVLDQVRKHGVRRLVHASTGALFCAAGVDVPVPLHEERHPPVPDSMYGITKYAAERTCLRLAELWKMDVRIGRLATAYGRWEYASDARDRLSPPTEIAKIAHAGGDAVFPPP